MTEQEFQNNISGADTFHRFGGNPDVYYWEGYGRGLRRNYHAEEFGTLDDHLLWSSMATDSENQQRRYRGIGYLVGLDGMGIHNAINHLN